VRKSADRSLRPLAPLVQRRDGGQQVGMAKRAFERKTSACGGSWPLLTNQPRRPFQRSARLLCRASASACSLFFSGRGVACLALRGLAQQRLNDAVERHDMLAIRRSG